MILLIILGLIILGIGSYKSYMYSDFDYFSFACLILAFVVLLFKLISGIVSVSTIDIDKETINLEIYNNESLTYVLCGADKYYYAYQENNILKTETINAGNNNITIIIDPNVTPHLDIITRGPELAWRLWLLPFAKTMYYTFYVPEDTIAFDFIVTSN